MTDHEKREKVFRGLSAHVNGHPHTRCHKCPYWGTGPHGSSECNVLAADALDLLKTQEPRVMTIDEVGTWVMIDRVDRAPIVVEVRNRFMAWVVGDEYYDLPDSNLSRELYGKEWRCWTSRPDDKRRSETPWTQTSG